MSARSSRAHHYEIGLLRCHRHAEQCRTWIAIDHGPLDIRGFRSGICGYLQCRLSMYRRVVGHTGMLKEPDAVDYPEPGSSCF